VQRTIPILVAPVVLAATANALTFAWLEWISDGRGYDGAQMLVRVAGATAIVGAVAIWRYDAPESGSSAFSAFLGLCLGVFTFLLAWVPALVLLALNPMT
jgi:hypothetical protein